MKYLGVDYGTKRVGIAVSDEAGTLAFPRAVVGNDEATIPFIRRVAEEEHISMIVVGDTRAASGEANLPSAQADRFIAALRAQVNLPVERGFEAWSSVEASRYAPKGRERDDAAAAAIILQRFLDMHPDGVE